DTQDHQNHPKGPSAPRRHGSADSPRIRTSMDSHRNAPRTTCCPARLHNYCSSPQPPFLLIAPPNLFGSANMLDSRVGGRVCTALISPCITCGLITVCHMYARL